MTNLIDRRSLLAAASLLASGAALPAMAEQKPASDPHSERMKIAPDAPKVAMFIYPKMIAIDLIGPMTVFNIMRYNVQLVWKDKTPVGTELDLPIAATQTFEECPKDVDILFVPGGLMGTIECMSDPDILAFLADRGARAKWVTSICTGSLVLGAAGLLKGYDATANWTVVDLLSMVGAKHVNKRYVRDRNRMTGAGATAGLDFALALAAEISGEEAARKVQLILEYSPEPPFKNGTPEEAGPERVAQIRNARPWMDAQARAAAEAAGKRMGIL